MIYFFDKVSLFTSIVKRLFSKEMNGQAKLKSNYNIIVNGYEIEPDADLSGADLSGADLSGADLSGANLKGANLINANLNGTFLSDAIGLLSSTEYIKENFELIKANGKIVGFYAYKTFQKTFQPPEHWIIREGSIITEEVNQNRTTDCISGMVTNRKTCFRSGSVKWKVKIEGLDILDVTVPYNTLGWLRVGRCELVEIVPFIRSMEGMG